MGRTVFEIILIVVIAALVYLYADARNEVNRLSDFENVKMVETIHDTVYVTKFAFKERVDTIRIRDTLVSVNEQDLTFSAVFNRRILDVFLLTDTLHCKVYESYALLGMNSILMQIEPIWVYVTKKNDGVYYDVRPEEWRGRIGVKYRENMGNYFVGAGLLFKKGMYLSAGAMHKRLIFEGIVGYPDIIGISIKYKF